MSKVALINPGTRQSFAIQEPLNIGFIASYLEKHNITVRIIDELAGQNVEKELIGYQPDIVGITAVTPLATDAYRIADLCRQKGISTVMGGVHASVMTEEALEHADIVIKGEGEVAMLDIVQNSIQSGVISRPYLKDINEVPLPARHLMQMDFYLRTRDRLPDTYLYFVPPHTKTASILTSRGCPYSCIFCHNTWRGTPYRFNSPGRVISEIKQLIDSYEIKALFFIEDNFFVDKMRVKKICELMHKENIKIMWGANARVDRVDLEILRIVKEAGCRQITFGFESGSQRILDVLKKGTTVEQNKYAIELCNQVGIIPQGTVIIGTPTETVEDVRATQRFLKESNIKSVGVCVATPYPGTELWEWCKNHNLIPQKFDWSQLDYGRVVIPTSDTLSPGQIEKLQVETRFIMMKKKSLSVFTIVHKIMINPSSLIKIFKYPLTLLNVMIKKIGKKAKL